MKLTKDGITIARNFTDEVPTYNEIWIHDSKAWIAGSKDLIKAELAKENKDFNPLDDVKVLPNDSKPAAAKKTTPKKTNTSSDKSDKTKKWDNSEKRNAKSWGNKRNLLLDKE